jgi:hypothetical protein
MIQRKSMKHLPEVYEYNASSFITMSEF